MEIKTIKNNTNQDHFIVYKGQQFILPAKGQPDSEMPLPAGIAKVFLEKHPGLIEEVKIGDEVSPTAEEEFVWIANVTGNPNYPKTLTFKGGYNKAQGGWYNVTCENPKRKPLTISRKMQGEMQEYLNLSDNTPEALNHFSKTLEVPPFKRLRLPKAQARWFLKRDGLQSPDMRGSVIKSRPQSEFEPNMSWPLDDMRIYLSLVDKDADLGPDEYEATHFKNKKPVKDPEIALHKAKLEMLKRLYFYLVDPKYDLPTASEFAEFKNGPTQEVESLSDDEVSALMAKTASDLTRQEKSLELRE